MVQKYGKLIYGWDYSKDLIKPLLKKLGENETIRLLSNDLYDMFGRETEKAGKEAANQINSGNKPVDAIINALNNNRLLSVVVRYMSSANKDLNELIVSMAKSTYGMDGVTKPVEYVVFLVLEEAFEKVDKTKARDAFDSLPYFLKEKLIPSESTYFFTRILQSKLK